MTPAQWQLTLALVGRAANIAFDEYIAASNAASEKCEAYNNASQLLSELRSECDAVNAEKGLSNVVAENQQLVQAVA
jgi:hypothetical protein